MNSLVIKKGPQFQQSLFYATVTHYDLMVIIKERIIKSKQKSWIEARYTNPRERDPIQLKEKKRAQNLLISNFTLSIGFKVHIHTRENQILTLFHD